MQPQFSDDQFAQMLALEGAEALVQPLEFILEADICTIGRAATCQIIVQQNLVSRLHARIERDGPLARCRALVELLEMKTLGTKGPRGDSRVH